jgi:phosphoribosylformimino-5-aminoimidazole carboxamide ribotide isomerase
MLIVPVLDLMGGQVVHARRGDRANYRPIESRLTPSADPLVVVAALLRLAPFSALYVADLDAIRGHADHYQVLRAILAEYPKLEVWLDAGFSHADALYAWQDEARLVPVIGSESQLSAENFAALAAVNPAAILSLDNKDGAPLGPVELAHEPKRWPRRVINMMLDRVGAGTGPAFEQLAALQAMAPDRQIIAAGGVRHAADLIELRRRGVYAVLLASALHNGSLDAAALAAFHFAG